MSPRASTVYAQEFSGSNELLISPVVITDDFLKLFL